MRVFSVKYPFWIPLRESVCIFASCKAYPLDIYVVLANPGLCA